VLLFCYLPFSGSVPDGCDIRFICYQIFVAFLPEEKIMLSTSQTPDLDRGEM